MHINLKRVVPSRVFSTLLISGLLMPFAVSAQDADVSITTAQESVANLEKELAAAKKILVAAEEKALLEAKKKLEELQPKDEANNKPNKSDEDEEAYVFEPKIRFFQPKARVFLDTGTDDEGEVDLFDDGAIVPNLNLVEYFKPFRFGKNVGQKAWRWGPALGFGLSAPASDSEDGSSSSSSAAVILLTAGLLAEFPVSNNEKGAVISVEVGYAQGITTDEGFGDKDDGAAYFGLGFDFNWD